MTQQSTLAYYASVVAKEPRKRKAKRYEVRLERPSKELAADALRKLIEEHGLRDVQYATIQGWGISESKFTDSEGKEQTLVMRNLFPSTEAINIEI